MIAGVRLATGAVLVLGLLAAPGSTARAATSSTTTVSPSTLTVTGLQVGYATVTTHLVGDRLNEPWVAVLPNIGSGPATTIFPIAAISRFVALRLVSGSLADGVWTARIPYTSGMGGTWRLDVVCDTSPSAPCTPPEISMAVVGSHVPRVAFRPVPTVVPYTQTSVLWQGTVTYDDTGLPVTTTPVMTGFGNCWTTAYTARIIRTATDAQGRFAVTLPVRPWDHACATAFVTAQVSVASPDHSAYPGIVGIRPSERFLFPRIHVGLTQVPDPSRRAVNGSVYAGNFRPGESSAYGFPLHLQRLYPDGNWRVVATSRVRSSGRYSLAVPCPGGTFSYRVWFASTWWFKGTTGRPFAMTTPQCGLI